MRFFIATLFLSLLITGCLSQDGVRSGSQFDGSTTQDDNDTTENPFGSSNELEFVVGSIPLSNPIIQPDSTNPIFLRGDTVSSFLSC